MPGNVWIASFTMITLTPITTPKNASSMKSTLRPVNGFGEANGLLMSKFLCNLYGVTKLSVADATSPSPISVTLNFTGVDFSRLSSEGAVTRSLSSVV